MNTYTALNVYCDAVTSLHEAIYFALNIGKERRVDTDFNTVRLFNNIASVVRALHDDLDEPLKTDESREACQNLYWHIHNPDGDESDDNIRAFRDVLIVLFHHAHESFQDMCTQRDKYGFEWNTI